MSSQINDNCINIPLDKFYEYLCGLHYYNEFTEAQTQMQSYKLEVEGDESKADKKNHDKDKDLVFITTGGPLIFKLY